jgi:two-component system phosphate regulon sensor histidine kinase PhoR
MKSIRSKLFTTFAALLLITFLLIGIGMTLFVRAFYLETVRTRLVEEARIAGELIKPVLSGYPDTTGVEELKGFVESLGEQTNARITLVAPDGTVLGDTFHDAALMDNHLNRPEIRAALQGYLESSIRYSNTVDQDMLYTAVALEANGEHIGFLRIALPLEQLNSAVRRALLWLLAGLLAFMLLTLAVTLKLASGLTEPLEQIAGVAEKIAHGELTSRLYMKNSDETGKLAEAINKMADSLQEQVKEVTEGKTRLETILSTMVEGILVFDNEGRAVMANPAAEGMLALQKNSWHGRRVLEIVRNTELHEKILTVSRDQVYLEHEIVTLFPQKKVLSVTLAPVSTTASEETGVLAVFHDITRIRTLEEMRVDFAANVSHELRTPLTAIQGFAETLLDGAYSEPEAARRFAEIIHREAQRLNSLIEDVLKLSQIESGKTAMVRKAVAIERLVSDVLERLGEKARDHKIKKKLAAHLHPVAGDPGLLAQALLNLLDNAVKYTQAGGTITISAEQTDGFVHLKVADNGIGIPAEARERIFERFYRVDRARSRLFGGTGLGLAIVKHIVETHSGRIELRSEEGKGTSVSMFLPVCHEVR